jgi:hypothetical protein
MGSKSSKASRIVAGNTDEQPEQKGHLYQSLQGFIITDLRRKGLRLLYHLLHPPLREAPSTRFPRHEVFSYQRTALAHSIAAAGLSTRLG